MFALYWLARNWKGQERGGVCFSSVLKKQVHMYKHCLLFQKLLSVTERDRIAKEPFISGFEMANVTFAVSVVQLFLSCQNLLMNTSRSQQEENAPSSQNSCLDCPIILRLNAEAFLFYKNKLKPGSVGSGTDWIP